MSACLSVFTLYNAQAARIVEWGRGLCLSFTISLTLILEWFETINIGRVCSDKLLVIQLISTQIATET